MTAAMPEPAQPAEQWVRFVRAVEVVGEVRLVAGRYQQDVRCLLEDGREVVHTFERKRKRDLVADVPAAFTSLAHLSMRAGDERPGVVRVDMGALARSEAPPAAPQELGRLEMEAGERTRSYRARIAPRITASFGTAVDGAPGQFPGGGYGLDADVSRAVRECGERLAARLALPIQVGCNSHGKSGAASAGEAGICLGYRVIPPRDDGRPEARHYYAGFLFPAERLAEVVAQVPVERPPYVGRGEVEANAWSPPFEALESAEAWLMTHGPRFNAAMAHALRAAPQGAADE